MGKFEDLTGRQFGVLEVIQRAENNKKGKTQWLCKCACGNLKVLKRSNLLAYPKTHCTCNRNMHGLSRTRLYPIWQAMVNRCHRPENKDYAYYGARGISVCDEWRYDFAAFYNWALKSGYSDNLSIDRLDGDGNYEPSNCRWTTKSKQTINRKNTVFVEYEGKTICLKEFARAISVPYNTVRRKHNKGISIGDIIATSKAQ